MAVEVAEPAQLLSTAVRQLALVWQNPQSRAFGKVARLHELGDGRFIFEYTSGANDPEFFPLAQFPDRAAYYLCDSLPAFFTNRVMSRQRESYPQFRQWLGLGDLAADTPIEILIRTGGPRATDTFHVVEEPAEKDGEFVIRFFASGLRYLAGVGVLLTRLSVGQELELRPEPTNPVDQRAILIDAMRNEPLGWVPAWLLDDVWDLILTSAQSLSLRVDQINLDAPEHLRLLCRLSWSPEVSVSRRVG